MAVWFIYMVSFIVSVVSLWECRKLWKGGNKPGSMATCFLGLSILVIIVLLVLDGP